jgi:hypothetical protein
MKNTLLILVLLLNITLCFGQKNKEIWTKNEKYQYATLTKLAKYVYGKKSSEVSNQTLYDKYIYFDYVLKDTVKNRREERLSKFDTIFSFFKKKVDSIGVSNLDAKPVRFYKEHKIYDPFDDKNAKESISGEKMYTKNQNVFAYYRKDEPENPLGVLVFEPSTNKLASWIMIDQGGYKYFLLFNLF